MEKYGNADIVHYGRLKSKNVTSSVLAFDLFAMVHGFDISSSIRLTLSAMLSSVNSHYVYTDFRSLYDSLTSIN